MENALLQFQSVTGKQRKFHLTEVNFSLYPGYIYALTGKNGAGKTTLLKHILEEKCRYHGNIFYNGMNISGHHAEAMQTIGYVSEENAFFEEQTCGQNAELLGLFYDDFSPELFHDTMKKLDLATRKTYKNLSRGERIKFQLAFATAHHSRLYLLDEATAGMDPVFRIEFFDMLRQLLLDETKCVLMTSHNEMEITKKTDYVAVMDQGRLGAFTESLDGIHKE